MTKKPKITTTMLARDVLKLLAAKKIKPESGKYCYVRGATSDDADLKGELRKGYATCEVCALGSLLVSGVTRFNGVSVGDACFPDSAVFRPIEQIVGVHQMGLIEAAFEQSTYSGTWNSALPEGSALDAAIRFGQHYSSDRNRLIAIMKNIIANRGKFRPEIRGAR